MKIELWSDFACPFCYIGKVRFDNALSKFEHKDKVELVFKAYQLNPNAPKLMTNDANVEFAKGHGTTPEAASEKFEMFVKNAKTVGLDYNYDIIQLTNTFEAHQVAKWARQFNKEKEVTDRFMKAYFSEGVNLADRDSLVKLVNELGLEGDKALEVLKTQEFANQVQAEILEARQVGVQGVPFFVLNKKYGVSGAQQEEYFTAALNQIWDEENPLKTIEGADEGATCNDESCELK